MNPNLRRSFTRLFTLGLGLTLLGGCASVNSVALTPIPRQRSNRIQAEVTKTVFLAFNFDNDFVDGLVDDLKRQCPNGVVSGILTKDETISYVLVFKKRIVATGFCNTAQAALNSVPDKRKRRPTSDGVVPADAGNTADAQVEL